jgi:DNA invertase Pin-like site-specific DNA recombinase
VSSSEQNLDLQRDALKAAGCSIIHEDEGVSGAARSRPGLAQALTMRSLIVERTRAGMRAARTRGRHLGRPVKLTGAKLRKAEEEIAAGREILASMAGLFGVDRSTLWRAIK